MKRVIRYGIFNGLGLIGLLALRTDYPIKFVEENHAILNLLITAICMYLAIASYINGEKGKNYSYFMGIAIGVLVSVIGISIASINLYIRLKVILGHDPDFGQPFAYFIGNLFMAALIPLFFIRQTRTRNKEINA